MPRRDSGLPIGQVLRHDHSLQKQNTAYVRFTDDAFLFAYFSVNTSICSGTPKRRADCSLFNN
jgi:hypothetical protein